MVKRESALPGKNRSRPSRPQLKRVLGRWDLVLLFVVAMFNLNVVPSIAANGGGTFWLWLVSLALFFWPQGIAVIELAHRYPGEGGVYLWAKEDFGDFHGFLSGWCYWTNNMLYMPTVLLYFVGVSVFVLGPKPPGAGGQQALRADRVGGPADGSGGAERGGPGRGQVGQQPGRHRNGHRRGHSHRSGRLLWANRYDPDGRGLPDPGRSAFRAELFGVMCFGLVGLELASVMGEEIRDPRQTLPGAVAWGGVISGVLYIGATLTLLVAVGKERSVCCRGSCRR